MKIIDQQTSSREILHVSSHDALKPIQRNLSRDLYIILIPPIPMNQTSIQKLSPGGKQKQILMINNRKSLKAILNPYMLYVVWNI